VIIRYYWKTYIFGKKTVVSELVEEGVVHTLMLPLTILVQMPRCSKSKYHLLHST